MYYDIMLLLYCIFSDIEKHILNNKHNLQVQH